MSGGVKGVGGPAGGSPRTGATGVSATGAGTTGGTDDARLRAAARQLEGVFTQQLFKAMRATVPEDQGVVAGGSGEEMFTGLLDERLATDPRAAAAHGIGDAIYQHLVRTRGAHEPGTHEPAATPAVTPGRAGASLRTASTATP